MVRIRRMRMKAFMKRWLPDGVLKYKKDDAAQMD